MPVIGFLNSGAPDGWGEVVAVLRQSLRDAGYIEGQNVEIDYRWALNRYDQLPALAADLVRRQVKVIVTSGGSITAQAAKAATLTIPIVFLIAADPVKIGLVDSFNRPDGNVTGTTVFGEVVAKRFEFIHELLPQAPIAFLFNPENPVIDFRLRETLPEVARIIGKQIQTLSAKTVEEIDTAFGMISERQIGAIVVHNDPLYINQRDQIIALAARYAVPAIYEWREAPEAGGLVSYGPRRSDSYRQLGDYTVQILKGAKPADLPIVLPTRFELVVNLKTAKALGLKIPEAFLLRADEVIE